MTTDLVWTIPLTVVIPAQAGIQAALADICEAGLDCRLRGNDELIGCDQAFRSLDSRLRGNDVVDKLTFLPESNSQEDSANV